MCIYIYEIKQKDGKKFLVVDEGNGFGELALL